MSDYRWTDRQWPDPRVTIRDQQTARACAPDASGDPVEDRNAWFWRTADGSVVAVTKITGSVHESAEPFGTLQDAAADFRIYWPAGFFWEEQGARDWMGYLAAKHASPPNGDAPQYGDLSTPPLPSTPPPRRSARAAKSPDSVPVRRHGGRRHIDTRGWRSKRALTPSGGRAHQADAGRPRYAR